MKEKSVTSFYSEDHDKLDSYFEKFQELKRRDYPQAKESFEKFMTGLLRHIRWEEEILFPLFEEKTGMHDGGPTFVMRQEHRQIELYLEALHAKVRKSDPNSEAEEEMLMNTLKNHNYKEENILYPAIDQTTSQEEQEQIFHKMSLARIESRE